MVNKKKKTKKVVKSTVEEIANEISSIVSPPTEKNGKYVVVRDDIRVSDYEYEDPKDPQAISERDFWNRVVKKWSPREKVAIVPFDKKKHRVW